MTPEQLAENVRAFLEHVVRNRPLGTFLHLLLHLFVCVFLVSFSVHFTLLVVCAHIGCRRAGKKGNRPKGAYLSSAFVSSTMGPSVPLDVSLLESALKTKTQA